MSINKTIKLGWDGVEYPITITMGIIDKIDEQVNLVKLVNEYEMGDARLTKIARMMAILLKEAGATEQLLDGDGEPVLNGKNPVYVPVSVDSVFHALFGSGEIKKDDIKLMVTAIFAAIFPPAKKKSTTPSPKNKKGRRKKKA